MFLKDVLGICQITFITNAWSQGNMSNANLPIVYGTRDFSSKTKTLEKQASSLFRNKLSAFVDKITYPAV